MSGYHLMTEADAARYLGLEPSRLSWLRRRGRGPRYRTLPSGELRYELEALQAWVEAGQPVIHTTSGNIIPFPGSGVKVRTVLKDGTGHRPSRWRSNDRRGR